MAHESVLFANRLQRARTRTPGADLSDLVPFIQGTQEATLSIRSIVSEVIGAEELEYVCPLGQGGFGTVFKCRYTPAQAHESLENMIGPPAQDGSYFVAVKKLKSREEMLLGMERDARDTSVAISEKAEKERKDAVDEFAREVLMLKTLRHPNVIGYIGCSVFGSEGGDGGGDELALVLEYSAHGSLKDLIFAPARDAARSYTVVEGLGWAIDIARGMDFLHHCKPPIMHRDLKPGNIMICSAKDGSRVAKVADFGLATLFISQKKGLARQATIALALAGDNERSRVLKQFKTTGGVGSLHYMAPENFRGEQYTDHVDQYSYGIIVYEILLRQRAWANEYLTEAQLAEAAASSKNVRPPLPKKWPSEIKELLAKCWHPDPVERPSFKPIAGIVQGFLTSEDRERIIKAITAGSKTGLLEKLGFRSVSQ